jgi:tubulin-specific chaperone A
MQTNDIGNKPDRSLWKNPGVQLFLKIFLNATIPMLILIFTLSYSKWGILLAFFTACILTLFLVNGIMHESSNHLLTLSQWINDVASGELEIRREHANNDIIQGLFVSFRTLVSQLIHVRDVCMAISKGNYSKFFSAPPPRNSIGAAVETLRDRVRESGLIAERHLYFLNNIPVPIIILTRSLEVEYMNFAAEKMFQMPVSKALGMHCKNVLKADQCKTGNCKALRAMEIDTTLITITNVHADNQVCPVRYTNIPIHDSNNNIIGVMKYIIDIAHEMKLVNMAERISNGDYSLEIEDATDNKRLLSALNQMTQTLRNATEENAHQSWIKTGQTELNVRLRGEQDIQSLAKNIIFFLCDYIKAPVGIFYIEKDTKFRLMASYAFSHRKTFKNEFEMGEGLVGQAALEKKIIAFNELPKNYISIQSGLGMVQPGTVVVVPLTFQEKVVGMIELGALNTFTQLHLDFLTIVSENIAVAINTSKARTRMSTLLAHSQNQSEELKVQQEELRQAYDDLEEQTKRLQKSESSLQKQHEELSKSNKALEQHTQLLEEQKEAISKKNETLKQQQAIIEQKANDLEMANRYKSEFLANMSHELRTPLNSILLLSGIVAENKEKNLTDKQKEFANTINMCGTDLLNLINEVLDLSKVESGRMEVYPEHFYLEDILSSLLKTFEPVANQRKLEFKTSILSSLPKQIFTDQQRLEQILKNILSNAFKFTKKGKISLRIKRPEKSHVAYEKTFERDELLLFEVEDTGIGIPIDKQEQIFEAFHQGDGTTKRRFGGTGLGLSIVKKMIHLLGGFVYLKSVSDKGSTFFIVVPEVIPKTWPHVIVSIDPEQEEIIPNDIQIDDNKKDSDRNELSKISNAIDEKPTQINNKPDRSESEKKILIVTHNNTIAGHIKSITEKQKFLPKIVNTPQKALESCQESTPEGIILDLGLPDWTCWLLYIQLNKIHKCLDTPVHWVSGLHLESPEKQKRMFFLKKNSTKTALQETIKSMNVLYENDIQTALIICKKDNDLQKQLENDLQINCIHQYDVLEASRYIETNPISILILDTSCTEMTGISHIDQLAQNARKAKIPTLFVTDTDIWEQEWIIPIMDKDGEIQKQEFNVMERMTDETLLFFHRLKKSNSNDNEQTMLIHDKDAILKGKKFLLVDDDMRNVFAISSVLEARGSTVIVGRNGNEGLKCLSEHPDIDLVLMDIMMPEMDGYEAITKIRENIEHQNLPIIALTAKAMKKDRDKCIQVGADDYMPKPVYPDKLISMLRVWLNR